MSARLEVEAGWACGGCGRLQSDCRCASRRGLTDDERALLTHLSRWGSDGYPINKLGRGWSWGPWRSVAGPPTIFRTKREAVESFERFYSILVDAAAGRI